MRFVSALKKYSNYHLTAHDVIHGKPSIRQSAGSLREAKEKARVLIAQGYSHVNLHKMQGSFFPSK